MRLHKSSKVIKSAFDRSETKTSQSGFRTYCLDLYFVVCCYYSVHFCRMILPEGLWAPPLPARGGWKTSHFFLFPYMALPQGPLWMHFLGEGALDGSSFAQQRGLASPKLVHVTGLPLPQVLCEHFFRTHIEWAFTSLSCWVRQSLIQQACHGAWESAFLTTFLVMLISLICRQIFCGQELEPFLLWALTAQCLFGTDVTHLAILKWD